MDGKNITMWVLSIILVGLLITVITIMIINMINTTNIQADFVKDMTNIDSTSLGKQDFIKLYNKNREQINCVYKNKKTRDAFKTLMSSNCLLIKSVKSIIDKILSSLITYETKQGGSAREADRLKGVIVTIATLVYIYQSFNPHKNNLTNMCLLLDCNNPHKKQMLAVTNKLLQNKNLYYTTGQNIGTVRGGISATVAFYQTINAPSVALKNDVAVKDITAMATAIDSIFDKNLDRTECNQLDSKYTASEFNSAHNLSSMLKTKLLIMSLPSDIKSLICHIAPFSDICTGILPPGIPP
jgi:hypothetical protein